GPLEDSSNAAGYQLLFGDLLMRRVEAGQPGGVPIEGIGVAGSARGGLPGGGRGGAGGRGPGGRGGAPASVMVEVVSKTPAEDAERLLRNVARLAYRRPVRDEEMRGFLDLFQKEFALGSGFARSMLTAYTGVLASPGFVFLAEKPGRLDAMALATRLSLFLWNSTPDPALRGRAEKGGLSDPDVLRAETERLLNDPRSDRFVEAF